MKSKIYLLLGMFFLILSSPLHAEESLTWQQCVNEAKEAHPDLASALALLQQAEADKRITGGRRRAVRRPKGATPLLHTPIR
jgi:hypothetical protein